MAGTSRWSRLVGGRRRGLASARARYEAVYAASPAGIVEVDLGQRIVSCNVAFAGMLGRTPRQVIGRHGWEFFHPDGPAADPSAVEDLVAGRRVSYSAERLLIDADGQPRPVKLDWGTIIDGRGQVSLLVCVVTDIGPQVAAAAALRCALERAEMLWEQTPIGVLEASPDGVIVAANHAVCAMLDYRREDLVGRPAADLADPAYAPEISDSVRGLVAGRTYAAERRYRRADGQSIPVYVSTAVLHDEQGAVSRLAGFVVDTSKLHAQREALAEALADAARAHDELALRQHFTDRLLDTVDVGIVSCDAAGGALRRNRAGRALLGLPDDHSATPAGEVAGLVEIVDGKGGRCGPADFPLQRVLRGDVLADVDYRLGPAGGPLRDVVVSGYQITDPDGAPAGAVVTYTDVTVERDAVRQLARERASLTEAQRLGQLGSFTCDLITQEFTFSEQVFRIWGLPMDADLATLRHRMIHPDDLLQAKTTWNAALVAGGAHTNEYRIVRPDGSVRHLRVALEVQQDQAGRPVFLQGTHLDVTDLTVAQRRAVDASAHLQAILTATPDYTFVTDVRTGAVVYGSPGKSILGITTEDLERLGPGAVTALVHPDDQEQLRQTNVTASGLQDGEVLQTRMRARHADGSWRWLSRRVTPFRREESTGTVTEVLGVMRDVTDLVEAEQQLAHNAHHDQLTGLANRALLMDRLTSALVRAARSGGEVAVLFCDLDGFKRVNDSAGHAAGDSVLVQAGRRLSAVVGELGTLARVGGDEFVVVLEPVAAQRDRSDRRAVALTLARRVAEVVREPMVVDGVTHVVSASIGITYADPGADERLTADAVLRDADTAMYHAKHGGKDRFHVFERGLRAGPAERGHAEQVLRRALAPSGQVTGEPLLSAVYQPVVDARTGALVAFEALARLSDGMPIATDVFVSVAEATGLVSTLGRVVLELGCAQLVTWRRELPAMQTVTMAVNVSASHAVTAGLREDVHDALTRHGLQPADLALELTESVLLNASPTTLESLRRLREDGVGISIDNFGTGYASLQHLVTLPLTGLKLDGSFAAGLPDDRALHTVVQSVAGLAADLGLTCVVKGVETTRQRAALPDGVLLQGWLTGRPAAASDLDVLRLLVSGV